MRSRERDVGSAADADAGSGRGRAGRVPRVRRWIPATPKGRLIVVGAVLAATSLLWGPPVLRRMAFFRVRRVEILGAHYVAPSDILGRLDVDTTASVWDPTKPLVARVATHPEIQRVVVRRKLPGTLVVEITERVPVALVPAPEGFAVYDERGIRLPIDPSRTSVDAPVLMRRDPGLLRLLGDVRQRMPDFYARVSTVQQVGRDELLVQLGDLTVRAMSDVTLDRLAAIGPVEGDLARKELRAGEIDLRYRDQVIARLQ